MNIAGSEHFHEELKKLGLLHDKKQADYGADGDPFANVRASEDFGIPAWVGCMVRANDKMRRIQTFSKGTDLRCERVEDSLQDLAVYSIIALCLFKEEDTRRVEAVYDIGVSDEPISEREREAVESGVLSRSAGGGGRILRQPTDEGEKDPSAEESPPTPGA